MTTKTTTYSIQGKASFQSKISGGACFACIVVRRFLLFLLLSALLTPLSTLFSSCGHDDLVPPDVYVDEPEPPYIELRIAIPLANPTATRANPMGGEEGNGREHGLENEDEIHDINVFLYIEEKDAYSGKGRGMDSKDDTAIIKHIYYNFKSENDSENTPTVQKPDSDPDVDKDLTMGYMSLRFECTADEMNLAKTSGINFVAIANLGSLQKNSITTLGQLRNIDLETYKTNTWSTYRDIFSKNAANMDYFLMSTAYNSEGAKYGYNKISPSGNNYIGTTTLQRMYARLDLWYNNSTDESLNNVVKGDDDKIKELKYKVKDATSNTVYLTNILPVNVMQSPSYLFKKVTDGLSSFNSSDFTTWASPKYCWGGKESPTDGPYSGSSYNDLPANYVMERHTLEKKTVDAVNLMSETEAATYTEETLKVWYGNTRASKIISKVEDDQEWSIFNDNNGKLNGYYDMHRDPAGSDPTDYNCNHISIISYANENTHPTDCFHSNYLTGLAFRAVYVPDADKIYSSYDKTTKVLTKLDQSATSIGGEIYRYSPTTKDQTEGYSLYFTSKTDADNYATDHPEDIAIISEPYTADKHGDQWGFVCYYNLWLRHYNDVDDAKTDPHPHLPMEYATVRNNIYRVSVSFRGPGDPTPTMREPDTMKARIFVRKWNYREEDKIIFD